MQDQALELRHEVEVEGRVVGRHEVVDEPDGLAAGLDADLLLAVLEDHVVAAVLAGAAGLAVADVRAGEVLELEGDVLGHVAGPGPVAEPRDEPAAPAEGAGVLLEGGQQLDEGLDEARDPCCSGTPRARPGPRPGGSRAPSPSSWRRAGRGSRGCAAWARGAGRPGPRPRPSAAAWPGVRGGVRRSAAAPTCAAAAVFLDRFGEAGSACATGPSSRAWGPECNRVARRGSVERRRDATVAARRSARGDLALDDLQVRAPTTRVRRRRSKR